MKEKIRYLKSQNTWLLWLFISVNIVLFWCVLFGREIELGTINILWKQILTKDGVIAALVPVITIVCNGLLNSRIKVSLIFWRFKNALPGCRVFTDIAKKDQRIDMKELERRLGSLPDDPTEQNIQWYKLYKKHKNSLSVMESHKKYLLCRDLTGLSAIFLFLIPIIFIFSESSFSTKIFYSLYLLLTYIILAIAARNYGNGFVCNVLVEEIYLN